MARSLAIWCYCHSGAGVPELSVYRRGLVTAPLGIFAVIVAPVIGRLLPRLDARVIATLAFVGFSGVFFLRSQYVIDVDVWHLVVPTLLQGIPMAMFLLPPTAIILSGQPLHMVPAAAGLSSFVRISCGAVGTSLASTFWNNRTILHHVQLTDMASVENSGFVQQIAAYKSLLHVDDASAYAFFNSVVDTQSAMLGLNDIFYMSSVIFFVIIPLIWITKPARSAGSANADSAH
jgi:MFS transporter, DHA2 family, multidrug resistance protein